METRNHQDQQVFEFYKPLRNAIRKLCLGDSLGVIRVYVQNLQFGVEIPSDCEVDPEYASATSFQQKAKWITGFHLETLCREIILHAMETGVCTETLRDWKTLARIINKLKHLEEFIAARFSSSDLLMQELHRTVHRQFPWQMGRPKPQNVTRYFLICSPNRLLNIKGLELCLKQETCPRNRISVSIKDMSR